METVIAVKVKYKLKVEGLNGLEVESYKINKKVNMPKISPILGSVVKNLFKGSNKIKRNKK